MTEPIEGLLAEADAAVASPPEIRRLAERVGRIAQSRRRRHIASVAIAAVIVGLAGSLWLGRTTRQQQETAQNTAEIERLRERIRSLNTEADAHLLLAEQIAQREKPRLRRHAPAALDFELDRAAYGLIHEADRMAADPALRDAAAEFYRQVQTELPQTAWSETAKQQRARLFERKEL